MFLKKRTRGVIVGRDTRNSGQTLKSAIESGILLSGLSFYDVGLTSTPVVSFLTRISHKKIGMIISASHNRHNDNGIKVFLEDGTKIPELMEHEIENVVRCATTQEKSYFCGESKNVQNVNKKYISFCKKIFSKELSLIGMKIVLDCSNGSTYDIAPRILQELGAVVVTVGCEPSGFNVNHRNEKESLSELRRIVIEKNAHLGILLDGDGDRISMVDHLGNYINGDQIIYIIVRDAVFSNNDPYNGGVIGTLMNNSSLEKELKRIGVPFIRSKVGEKYIIQKMSEYGWKFGAESSGHIILLDHSSTSDGIIAGLQVLKIMVKNQTSLFNLCQGIKLMPQTLVNIKFDEKKGKNILNDLKKIVEETRRKLRKDERIIFRKSGTEKLIRIMIEGQHKKGILKFVHQIKNLQKSIDNS
ncbi:hypothetical protein AOQ87_01420 [Candidatus Riesia pediculischaeffi]|uniref:Phosphoglucosamine mutase n=1 Tax=Candidatus Riesia pediculischaeffi TaxID=428411 RepID=A0A1V0HKR7_9ENTR|nr:hypothetical protein AOQ87_01420 [Candidatus Riesia pediculischaeffi]